MTLYYVAPTGNDGNSGLDFAHAWLTGGRANSTIKPGDIVRFYDGQFNAFSITVSGTPGNLITFQAVNILGAKIVEPTNSAIVLLANYLTIQGFDVTATGTNGTGIDGSNSGFLGPHHINIINNYIHDCGSNGIGLAGGDYYTIHGNDVARNAATSPFFTSGITIYQPKAFDFLPGFHITVNGNICRDNIEKMAGSHSDGEGLILDDFKNTQSSPWHTGVVYTPASLVENNLFHGNGGPGAETGGGGAINVTFRYNTSYKNNVDLSNNTEHAEISLLFSDNCSVYGNITVCDSSIHADAVCLSDDTVPVPNTGNTFDRNSTFDTHNPGSNSIFLQNSTAVFTNMYYHTDPLFVAAGTDFTLQATSPARAAGSNSTSLHPVDDLPGNIRSTITAADIGAYMYLIPGGQGWSVGTGAAVAASQKTIVAAI